MTATVVIDANVIDMLVRTHWLPPREFHSRAEIANALSAMISEATHG
jgi:hypothetical protein